MRGSGVCTVNRSRQGPVPASGQSALTSHSSASTGFLAANQLLADRGLSGHDLWTVPMRSRNRVSAPLHRLLTH